MDKPDLQSSYQLPPSDDRKAQTTPITFKPKFQSLNQFVITAPPPDFGFLSEHCGLKSGVGIIGGGIMGLGMGVFLGAMSDLTPPVTVYRGREIPQIPLKEQMRSAGRATGEKAMYWCKNFAFITGVFTGSECLVEKARGKTDVWNQVVSGCVTGAAMQAKSGPQASLVGCGGFAAFSLIIDKVMGD